MVKNNSYQELLSRFNAYFDTHLPFPIRPAALYDPCRYILEDSGKRIRPLLCLLSNQMFEGEEREDVYKVAMSLELFHNFTLIHDDIMDDAPLRRGKQTLHEKYGITSGILSGDVMNIYSYKCLAEVRPHLLKPILDLFNATAIEVCEGQQMDMNYESLLKVSIPQYIKMIELKTAVLLAGALKIGALIGGAREEDAQHLYDFGKHIGIAFQLQDDILDVYANADKFGKQKGGDIIANKKTFLLLKAMEMAENNRYMKEELQQWIAAPQFDPNEKVEAVTNIYNFLNVKELARNEMQKQYELGISALKKIPANEEKKQALIVFADSLMVREV